MVNRIIAGTPTNPVESLLCSILSGPIDIDKMDYLFRDSLHCGVPYGMNFDAPRLINSLCLNESNEGIAITAKGKTAAEMMVFSRYVMFSEVYWHHTARSFTAMLQRQVYDSYEDFEWDSANLVTLTDQNFSERFSQSDGTKKGLLGVRQPYKRLLDYNADQNPEIYNSIAHQPYEWLIEIGNRLAQSLTKECGTDIAPHEILVDAPPTGLEVQFKVPIKDGGTFKTLGAISPVVKALAQKQFDDFVKRVRLFIHPRHYQMVDASAAEKSLIEVAANTP